MIVKSMKINILFLGNTTHPAGGFKVVYEYCNKLVEYGHDVVINYLYGPMLSNSHLPDILRKPIIKVYSEIIGPGKWFKLDKKIRKRVLSQPEKMGRGDIVIATAIQTAEMVKKLPDECGKKVYFIQGFENWSKPNEEVYESYNYGMTNICVAKWLQNMVEAHSCNSAYLVSNCIDTDVFNQKNMSRRKHSIVFHYRSADYKGPQYALEAIRRLEEKYDDLYVDVISIEDEPENLPKSCVYHKSISAEEIVVINNRTEIFMCTSIEEGFGLPGLEAMACGCAVVSTAYKGVLEYAIDGENALLSPARDIDAMVSNIVKLFEDDGLRKKISDKAVRTGAEKSLENSAREFEKILLKTIKGR